MNPKPTVEAIDTVAWRRQRNLFPPDQLQPFWGKCVAWSADGTRVVASGDSWDALYDELARLGIHPCSVVDEFIDDPNEVHF
jgi:hypothetical protein